MPQTFPTPSLYDSSPAPCALLKKRVDIVEKEIMQKYYAEVESMYTKMRGWRHDYRHHIHAKMLLFPASRGVGQHKIKVITLHFHKQPDQSLLWRKLHTGTIGQGELYDSRKCVLLEKTERYKYCGHTAAWEEGKAVPLRFFFFMTHAPLFLFHGMDGYPTADKNSMAHPCRKKCSPFFRLEYAETVIGEERKLP